MALALAEEHEHGELYKEASRFVLDQRTFGSVFALKYSHVGRWRACSIERIYAAEALATVRCRLFTRSRQPELVP